MKLDERGRGFALVFATAAISGVSIFLNKFALASFNPFVFATLKNSVVALFLVSGLLLTLRYRELLQLKLRDWRNLLAIGIIGGSIPFLLFFWGLSQTSAANGSLLQKSLFIPASALAFIFLKEKLSKMQLAGTFLLFIGAAAFAGFSPTSLTIGDAAIVAAVLFWSAEDVISKYALRNIAPATVVFGRMFFGSLAMVAFLAATSQLPNIAAFTASHYLWLLLTSLLLLGYNLTFYSGLKRLKVGEATAVLLFGSVVTTALSLTVSVVPKPLELLGAAAVTIGLCAIALSGTPKLAGAPVAAPAGSNERAV